MSIDDLRKAARNYIGGQLGVQSSSERYRGEIANITIKDNELQVELLWNAKCKNFNKKKLKYTKDNKLYYTAELRSISDINKEGTCLISSLIGETIILFPKGGSRLDPAKVKGLHKIVG